jgi:hypothetical protein
MLRFNGLVNRIGRPTDAGELVWIVFHTALWLLKKIGLFIGHFDSQAFTSALSHQNRLQLAALYTLQYGLSRNTPYCPTTRD